jgi:hypothetical protein
MAASTELQQTESPRTPAFDPNALPSPSTADAATGSGAAARDPKAPVQPAPKQPQPSRFAPPSSGGAAQ